MVKPLALLDVCDVAVDLHVSTIREARLGIDLSRVSDWDIFSIITPDEVIRVKALYDDPGFWRALPPVPGVQEGVEGLQRAGYDIHWITSPWHSCRDWEGVRRAWLKQHFPWFSPLDMTSTALKWRFDGDMLVDDRPKHIEGWQRAHPAGVAWLFDTPFNRHFDWPTRGTWCPEGIKAVQLPRARVYNT